MGAAKCPRCGHVHETGFSVARTKRATNAEVASDDYTTMRCDGCNKQMTIVEE